MGFYHYGKTPSVARQGEEIGVMKDAISILRLGRPEWGQGSIVHGDSRIALVLPFKLYENQCTQSIKFETLKD